jgi:tRNA pseudouridine55 synthase
MLLATVYKNLPRGLCYSSTRNKALKNDEINIRDSPYSTAWQSPGHSKWTFDNAKEADDIKSLRRMEEARLNRRRTPAQKVLEKPAVITQIPAQLEKSVVSNALLLVDKPQDWSHQEVEQALRWSLKMKSVSSPGQLEPFASGLMVLCLGRATKLSTLFHEQTSTFSGTIKLGEATNTFDATGQVTDTLGWDHVSEQNIRSAVNQLLGETLQVPPPYSSVKFGGRRSVVPSQLSNSDGDMRPRPVYVHSFQATIMDLEHGVLHFSITIGQSSMIRSVAHDLGRMLGTCSHLVTLRRERIGAFSVEDAWTLDVVLPLLKRYRS